MPYCEECMHTHTNTCGCGCLREACGRCGHHHGSKSKRGECSWCACSAFEVPRKKEEVSEEAEE